MKTYLNYHDTQFDLTDAGSFNAFNPNNEQILKLPQCQSCGNKIIGYGLEIDYGYYCSRCSCFI